MKPASLGGQHALRKAVGKWLGSDVTRERPLPTRRENGAWTGDPRIIVAWSTGPLLDNNSILMSFFIDLSLHQWWPNLAGCGPISGAPLVLMDTTPDQRIMWKSFKDGECKSCSDIQFLCFRFLADAFSGWLDRFLDLWVGEWVDGWGVGWMDGWSCSLQIMTSYHQPHGSRWTVAGLSITFMTRDVVVEGWWKTFSTFSSTLTWDSEQDEYLDLNKYLILK